MKRPYRSLDFNDERKWKSTGHLLDDVLQVGKLKAVGYVLENTNYVAKEFDMQALAEQLYAEGKIIRITQEKNLIFFWAGDAKMMSLILDFHKDIIEQNGWPTTPEAFLDRISIEKIDHGINPNMYHIVCDLFNSWCLWCETPIWKKFVDGSTRAISAHPYDPDIK